MFCAVPTGIRSFDDLVQSSISVPAIAIAEILAVLELANRVDGCDAVSSFSCQSPSVVAVSSSRLFCSWSSHICSIAVLLSLIRSRLRKA